MPENTLYAEYDPCIFGPLMIKMKTLSTNDWVEQQIVDSIDCTGSEDFWNKLNSAEHAGFSVDMDFNCCGRNGLFEGEENLYAVFEKKDIEQLIARLELCLNA